MKHALWRFPTSPNRMAHIELYGSDEIRLRDLEMVVQQMQLAIAGWKEDLALAPVSDSDDQNILERKQK